MSFEIRKAAKKDQFLRLAMDGVSGSGKTWTSLLFAKRLAELCGGRITLIDTEERSSELYADEFDFDVIPFDPPYTPKRYREALAAAGKRGGITVIDSLSHAWFGEGGELEMKDLAAKKLGGNTYYGWRDVTPEHNALIDAMLRHPAHLIITMRSKADYVVGDDKKVTKVGTKPIMREGIEYEFQIAMSMDTDHVLTVSKSRCRQLDTDTVIKRPDERVADTLWKWLHGSGSTALSPELPPARQAAVTSEEGLTVYDFTEEEKDILRQKYGKMTGAQLKHALRGLTKAEALA